MHSLILYIATSIDGFMARSDGRFDWRKAVPNPNQLDYGYAALYESVDTTLMGNETYKTMIAFSGDQFPYADKTNYVFGRQPNVTDEAVALYERKSGFALRTVYSTDCSKFVLFFVGLQPQTSLHGQLNNANDFPRLKPIRRFSFSGHSFFQ
ncbi:dihydrofolate reductase family protein [Spirosoma pomorum]